MGAGCRAVGAREACIGHSGACVPLWERRGRIRRCSRTRVGDGAWRWPGRQADAFQVGMCLIMYLMGETDLP